MLSLLTLNIAAAAQHRAQQLLAWLADRPEDGRGCSVLPVPEHRTTHPLDRHTARPGVVNDREDTPGCLRAEPATASRNVQHQAPPAPVYSRELPPVRLPECRFETLRSGRTIPQTNHQQRYPPRKPGAYVDRDSLLIDGGNRKRPRRCKSYAVGAYLHPIICIALLCHEPMDPTPTCRSTTLEIERASSRKLGPTV